MLLQRHISIKVRQSSYVGVGCSLFMQIMGLLNDRRPQKNTLHHASLNNASLLHRTSLAVLIAEVRQLAGRATAETMETSLNSICQRVPIVNVG
ncbi:hypothetical protein DPEC_G00015080 [Dallia pectoralis]|uniref:Uncharacterized protein n=1 Tax=Dallia pectoralis TaxID=75939 RepID=A0ACC2HN87_DALPE|nr:hypothetical protein DPEC_G00015080 [Dallia pectoralis]